MSLLSLRYVLEDGSIDKWNIIKTHFLEHFPDVMIYGKWDAPKVIKGKYDFDVVGHYSRPDIFKLKVNKKAKKPVQ